ncbi:MAG: glycosyltransferase, partial [Microbacterium sp.]
QLTSLLATLGPQIAELQIADVSVMVVDNDPDGDSAAGCAQAAGAIYIAEPTPGIAAVRNRALDSALGFDALIFIDDDEVPQPLWLEQLVQKYISTGADAVAGRVETVFPDEADPWVRASGAFQRPQRVDGQVIPEVATNNLLLDLAAVRDTGLRFDERFGLSGGSDSLFTREFTKRGKHIVWAQHAAVLEQEDASRFTRAWVLQRYYRFGNTRARVDILTTDGSTAFARVRAVAKGTLRVSGGGAKSFLGAVTRSLSRRAHGERTMAIGRGMIAAAFGSVYLEYALRRSEK